ncbi:endoplasmic reticulum metallopeptidase 1-like [Topomyia yanbarensis]|uniref:endoplasmic reticulum metallopeptidase 1-like n=1 Tax=Topomyia yanbarensis TaxID=2498891 RepID=UPI00273B60AC|nr:endoplasmic reticulum metallopeptidase 1-like [Topomyia yanbarensis]
MKLSRNHTIPLLWSILFPLFGIGIYFLVYWNWSTLPDGVLLENETQSEPVFVAERAQQHLRALTSQGTRVVGSSANEVFAVNFLVETIREIIREADPSNLLSVEVQDASGSYFLDYADYPITSYYRGVQNVIATIRKRSTSQFSGQYLLLNAHFDSAVTSPGAGDDGTMVAVMLEILEQISKYNLNLQHGIIFLFNGCEENTMQGAHGFVTGHPLAKDVSAFINLDVAANGGREIMFQSGPGFPFLMEYYQRYTKRPYANSLGEEVFQLGLVPSFTDFETLSKVGKWPGLDFALASYGYLYHTKYDAFDTISLATLQHIGDNLLPLTIGLAWAEELVDVEMYREEAATFFDFLHWFKLTYNQAAAYAINCVVAVVALIVLVLTIVMMVRREGAELTNVLLECGITLIVQTLSIVAGAGVSVLVAVIVDLAGRSMAWFTSSWLLFGLYFVPFIACLTLGPWLYIRFRKVTFLHNQGRVLLFLHAQCFIYVALLLTLAIGGIRSAYLFLFPVVFYTLSTIINTVIKFKLNHWIYVHLACQIIPLIYFCSLTVTVFAVFIPMTGRGDAGTNPDLMMALFSVLMALLLVAMWIPLMTLASKVRYFYTLLGLSFVVTVIVMATPIGFPFRDGTSPQRYYIFHQQSNFYHQNGTLRRTQQNFFLYPQDRHTPDYLFDEVALWREQAQPVEPECSKELYCGFPLYINRYHRHREYSYWMPANSAPNFPEPVNFRLLERQDISPTSRIFRFSIEGPTLMGFYFSPLPGNSLVDWTFSEKIPPSGTPWNGQSVYYVNYVQAKTRSPLEFFVEIELPVGSVKDAPVLLVSVVGQYMYHEQHLTEEFKALLNQMPAYAHTVAYPNYLESWEF